MTEDRILLEARLDDRSELRVGERAVLRIGVQNGGPEMKSDGTLMLHAPPPLFVVAPETERGLAVPPLLRGERFELALDVYALAPGEGTIDLAFAAAEGSAQTTLRCACTGRAAFSASANRVELFTTEAEPGAEVDGRVIVTNTGTAAASLAALELDGDFEAVVVDGDGGMLAPCERRFIALRGRVPATTVLGAALRITAAIRDGDRRSVLGEALLHVRSRPHIECTAELDAHGARAHFFVNVARDGNEMRFESEPVAVAALDAVAEIAFVLRKVAPQASCGAFGRSERARLDDAMLRHLGSLGGLMRHLWALAVLCADEAAEPRAVAQLATLRVAMRSVFDRLSIKLRMTHYPVRADDILDPAALDALVPLLPGIEQAPALGARLAACASLIAPLGSALGAPDVGAHYAAYRARFDAVLRHYDDAELVAALVAPEPALDDALDLVLAGERASIAA